MSMRHLTSSIIQPFLRSTMVNFLFSITVAYVPKIRLRFEITPTFITDGVHYSTWWFLLRGSFVSNAEQPTGTANPVHSVREKVSCDVATHSSKSVILFYWVRVMTYKNRSTRNQSSISLFLYFSILTTIFASCCIYGARRESIIKKKNRKIANPYLQGNGRNNQLCGFVHCAQGSRIVGAR